MIMQNVFEKYNVKDCWLLVVASKTDETGNTMFVTVLALGTRSEMEKIKQGYPADQCRLVHAFLDVFPDEDIEASPEQKEFAKIDEPR